MQKVDLAQNPQYAQEFDSLDPRYLLKRPTQFEEEFLGILEGQFDGTPCPLCPRLSFRPGEVTLWGGINGHGKSLLTGQIAMQMADKGIKSCICSLEMSGGRTLARQCRQVVGHWPTPTDGINFLQKYDQSLVLMDYRGVIDPKVVLGAAVVAARDFLCEHIFVDNLMKCVAGEDDYNGQKRFVQSLCSIASQLGVHIHLVHHVRKGDKESDEIGKFSFRGTGAITDQVDNVVTIQRNRTKEAKRQDGTLTTVDDQAEGDSILGVCKQRNGDFEGRQSLWFNAKAAAFCVDSNRITPWGGHDYD